MLPVLLKRGIDFSPVASQKELATFRKITSSHGNTPNNLVDIPFLYLTQPKNREIEV